MEKISAELLKKLGFTIKVDGDGDIIAPPQDIDGFIDLDALIAYDLAEEVIYLPDLKSFSLALSDYKVSYFRELLVAYSSFIHYPIGKSMFVPCDLAGNVLSEPRPENKPITSSTVFEVGYYNDAVNRVLFTHVISGDDRFTPEYWHKGYNRLYRYLYEAIEDDVIFCLKEDFIQN